MRNSPSVKFLRESGRHLTKMRENPLYTGLLNGEVFAKHLTRHLTRHPTIFGNPSQPPRGEEFQVAV